MKEYLYAENFKLDPQKKTLTGKLCKPIKSLVGARVKIDNIPKVSGFVIEVFEIKERLGFYPKIDGVNFQDGDFFGEILIEKGFEKFEDNQIDKFYLEECTTSLNQSVNNLPKGNSTKNRVWMGFRNVSSMHFGKYYIDIRGGETGGQGQNEHGPPHVHIIEFKTQKDLGKIYFPRTKDWQRDGSNLRFEGKEIKRKMKKEIIAWFNMSNLKNLSYLNREWLVRNQFNNRIE